MIKKARDPIRHLEPVSKIVASRIRHEIHVAVSAIIDKVIWQGCNLDILALSIPEIVRVIAKVNLEKYPEIEKHELAGIWIHIRLYTKKEVYRCFKTCERR